MDITKNNPLFYFSGTGGCLTTAKKIAKELLEYQAVPIASLSDGYTVTTDTIGLVFPVYFFGLPRIAAEFISHLEFSKPCYIFAVIPCGHPFTGYSLKQINRLLKSKGQRLSAGFYLKMTDSYLPIYNIPSEGKAEIIYRRYDKNLDNIISLIRKRNKAVSPSFGLLFSKFYYRIISTVNQMDEHFSSDEHCNGCGLCQKVCPVNNITMTDAKPKWKHHCESCLACIHFCPQQAIQWKNATQNKGRYHFKGITASDISKQKQT